MKIICNKPMDDKIVVFGQSCVGKTTFATSVNTHTYYCFDHLFRWHDIETLGLSIEANLKYIQSVCADPRFVLDGWHLSDKEGFWLPAGAAVYVVYAPYKQIISQYRVPVLSEDEHTPMFRRWYCEIDYGTLPGIRYFSNEGDFVERTPEEFTASLERSR